MERGGRRWKNLKERLGFTGCCGSVWRFSGEMPADEETVPVGGGNSAEGSHNRVPEEECPGQLPTGSGMNLAAALAAERQFRATTQECEGVGGGDPPVRVSLMKLLGGEEEREREGGEEEEERERGGMCCVCMGRRKGAAFIPCGHTFCRVCSREVWMNRGACPLCNRPILEILDIF